MDKALLKEKKKEANGLKPMFQLGKAGITEQFIDLVEKYIKVHEIIKIKVLTATCTGDIEYYATEVAKQTKATVLEKKGYTFTIYRRITKQDRKDAYWEKRGGRDSDEDKE